MYINALLVITLIILSGVICAEGSQKETDGFGPFIWTIISFIIVAAALVLGSGSWLSCLSGCHTQRLRPTRDGSHDIRVSAVYVGAPLDGLPKRRSYWS